MTLRKVGVLVAGLPPESATVSKLAPQMDALPDADAVARRWSTDQHLLAHIADGVSVLTWTLRQVHSKDRVPAPDMIPRPGEPGAQRRRLTPEQRAKLNAKVRRG